MFLLIFESIVTGDPNDQTLRVVEKEVLIPKMMRERARKEKCVDQVREFNSCSKENGVMLVFRCRKENSEMQECYKRWYLDENFKKECTEMYLAERAEYRRTGIPKRDREAEAVQAS